MTDNNPSDNDDKYPPSYNCGSCKDKGILYLGTVQVTANYYEMRMMYCKCKAGIALKVRNEQGDTAKN